ncbi:hypothetical protein LOK49_LG08G00232 [Camellia lanceoleosa]|uniref:Uncharacterized protein n=1 Tax=Camellia lanceoleosa TaxID=1840588 RepID=A0ACC0GSX9_9ERIC|nr:hypothetical protein LOK49_LG08G00232 [Camellia lanceoleosa]
MEDTQLEEGEACYYKDDTSVDPDIALSCLDEKLHSVLGHFQKDFEGGVSAENLGAKFGGYGSFLPTYQRSLSVRPQSKTPQRVQNFSSPRSHDVLPIERPPSFFVSHNFFSMTSFPVPGGLLLSSLHESLLCLARNEKLSQNSKPVAAIKSKSMLLR